MAYRSTMCFSCYRLPAVLQSHVCVRVTALVRRLFSQCSGLIRRGATRLTSDLESRGAPHGDSTSYNNLTTKQQESGRKQQHIKTAWTERQRGAAWKSTWLWTTLGERLFQQEIECRPLPVKSKEPVSLLNECTGKFTVYQISILSNRKETHWEGLHIHVDSLIELHKKRKICSERAGRAGEPCSVACTNLHTVSTKQGTLCCACWTWACRNVQKAPATLHIGPPCASRVTVSPSSCSLTSVYVWQHSWDVSFPSAADW